MFRSWKWLRDKDFWNDTHLSSRVDKASGRLKQKCFLHCEPRNSIFVSVFSSKDDWKKSLNIICKIWSYFDENLLFQPSIYPSYWGHLQVRVGKIEASEVKNWANCGEILCLPGSWTSVCRAKNNGFSYLLLIWWAIQLTMLPFRHSNWPSIGE